MSAFLQANGLACGYDGTSVFSGVDLAFELGEVSVLIGPNGSGKTTLLHALDRLVRPLAGQVRLEGKSIWELPPREVARTLALAPQRAIPTAWPLTVIDAVLLGRAPHRGWLAAYTREDRAKVEVTMDRLGLTALAERTVSTLSGGEIRRVLLARALVQSPRVLILDEPLTYLDLHYQAELLQLIKALAHQEGMAVILTVHDLAMVALCADRVALLAQGRICAVGTPAEVVRADVLAPIYGERVEVFPHPRTGLPIVLPQLPR